MPWSQVTLVNNDLPLLNALDPILGFYFAKSGHKLTAERSRYGLDVSELNARMPACG